VTRPTQARDNLRELVIDALEAVEHSSDVYPDTEARTWQRAEAALQAIEKRYTDIPWKPQVERIFHTPSSGRSAHWAGDAKWCDEGPCAGTHLPKGWD